MPQILDEFVQLVQDAIMQQRFRALTLSAPRRRGEELPRKQTVRPAIVQRQPVYQWELQFARQTMHVNLDAKETLERLQSLFGQSYREAYLYTLEADIIARSSGKGVHLQKRPPTRPEVPLVTSHDRAKPYLIPEGVPCPFLEALDVMTSAGHVHKAKQKKFRQINRYLEIVNDVYSSLPAEGRLSIVDFGCGLSYLTFAVHHLLTHVHRRDVDLLGIDQNPQVISRCESIAANLNLPGIRFCQGTISDFSDVGPLHLAISLHACDTATDAALAYAAQRRADIILAAPCCQHELATTITCPDLEPLLRQGILKERFAALATDALRATALEAAGYKTRVIEFIDLEHTPKNLLIRAVHRKSAQENGSALDEYQRLKDFLQTPLLATDTILMDLNSGRDAG